MACSHSIRNSASNAGREIVIVQGATKHYYTFYASIVSNINQNMYVVVVTGLLSHISYYIGNRFPATE